MSEEKKIQDIIDPGCILAGVRGSIAHGMYVPPSDPDSIDDEDYMSVTVAPIENYLGLTEWGSRGTKETFIGRLDVVEYEIRKYISLLIKGNPNVLSLLWLRPDQYIKCNASGTKLITYRDMFMSKVMISSFLGYATSQLTKMGAMNHRGFRGKKRAELIERYGYDTKNAAHCVRLLRMCLEFLQGQGYNVDRTEIDAEELLGLKRGAWGKERVLKEAEALKNQITSELERSDLPDECEFVRAENLCIEIIQIEHPL